VASRVGRLFPAYWAAVVLAMAFAFVIWPAGSVADGHAPTKLEALVNLTMMQGAVHVPDLSGAFWTLWTEARFYALLAVFILIGITRRRVLAFATLWPVAGVVAERMDQHLLSNLLIFDYAPYFAGGMLLYLIYREGHDAGTWLLVGLQALLAMVFAVDLYPKVLTRATGWPVSSTLVALVSLACFALVAVVALSRLNRYTARWITFLGALTYPLYLVHEKIGFFTIRVLRDSISPWLALGAALVTALAVATLLHYAVERPWGSRLRAVTLRGLQHAAPAPPTARGGQPATVPEPRTEQRAAVPVPVSGG
jgi:peptidoglycan/LPS O-acetylase OafA/YrhL